MANRKLIVTVSESSGEVLDSVEVEVTNDDTNQIYMQESRNDSLVLRASLGSLTIGTERLKEQSGS